MAQLKDTAIKGNLDIDGVINLQTNKGIRAIHPTSGDLSSMLYMSNNGNTILGHDGYKNADGSSYIYGNDVSLYIASAGNINFRPYRRAGDSMTFNIRTSGYVTNSSTDVTFLIPTTIPIIGVPTATATSIDGFILRQGNTYTHGSSASAYVTPVSYSVSTHLNFGFIVTAKFDVTTNATNNDAIGILWSGTITLS